jgi:pyruvate dehydrogenase E2 component (dihydrolipoamide acetyltransferase)
MVNKVIMPKLGETMEEGEIIRWLKKEGDEVKEGEPLLEIATDKANMEVEASFSGFLRKIVAPGGKIVPVAEVIAYIADSMEEEIPGEVKKRGEGEKEIPQPSRVIKTSPLARKLAREHNIDLSRVEGTGPGGRIVKEDVLKLTGEEGVPSEEVPSLKEIFLSGVGKIIAERMQKSKKEIPHFYLTVEVDFSYIVKMRKDLDEELMRQRGVHLTYTDLLVKACGYGLKEVPQTNSIFKEGKIYLSSEINVGLAVVGEEGLVVPVIKDVDKKDLFQIAEERERLVKKARENKLSLEELEGSSFTLSNLGMFGVKNFSAIINPPQVCILAVGEIKDRVVAVEGRMDIRPIMEMTLSCDHRVIDGFIGAKFLQKIRKRLERPRNDYVHRDNRGNRVGGRGKG